ncbi:MAG TPA: protein-L-isoaspartate(D-aspartate) O-methyltransferase [Anaeromyxobacteraceae bacterium]|nr:protein-L-isoaspartate(D-aspartate) O-methyltransferase [Anaeromyxobacteraceae bacterium]
MSEALARDVERMGIRDERVLRAMAGIPRRLFVPEHLQAHADGDHPLPIGFGQTISQPFMVAWMTEALALKGSERVLEIGTGSGYQAAILSRLCERVFTVELLPALSARARTTLAALGVANVEYRQGDGALGWPEEAPFDGILVTAAALRTPPALVAQLKAGGRLLIPIGAEHDVQYIHLLRKDAAGEVVDRALCAVRFVPLRSGGDVALGWRQ